VKDNTICAQGGVHGVVNKLSPIIGLKALNGKAELGVSISNKINDMLMYIGFVLKRERPTIVRKIIQQNQVVGTTRNTSNRRGPDITVNYLKR